MNWQEFLRDYLSFTRKERIGVITLIILIFLVAFYPLMTPSSSNKEPNLIDSSLNSVIEKLKVKNPPYEQTDQQKDDQNEDVSTFQFEISKGNYGNTSKGELFYFDPNSLNEAGWQKLGIRDKTIKTIKNFISKGGSFKKPDDLKKIYGLNPKDFERLTPFIKIESRDTKSSDQSSEIVSPKNYKSIYSIIEINEADTTAFISLPGIGSKLANRIISFREKLGGFYTVEQVGETYALPDSTFQKIKKFLKLENTNVKKININSATVDELKAHPYIKYSLANPIIAYRNEHGPFLKIEDIKKIMVVTEKDFKKMAPYLAVQ